MVSLKSHLRTDQKSLKCLDSAFSRHLRMFWGITLNIFQSINYFWYLALRYSLQVMWGFKLIWFPELDQYFTWNEMPWYLDKCISLQLIRFTWETLLWSFFCWVALHFWEIMYAKQHASRKNWVFFCMFNILKMKQNLVQKLQDIA